MTGAVTAPHVLAAAGFSFTDATVPVEDFPVPDASYLTYMFLAIVVFGLTCLTVYGFWSVYFRLRLRWSRWSRYEREAKAACMRVGESAGWSEAGSFERAAYTLAIKRRRRVPWTMSLGRGEQSTAGRARSGAADAPEAGLPWAARRQSRDAAESGLPWTARRQSCDAAESGLPWTARRQSCDAAESGLPWTVRRGGSHTESGLPWTAHRGGSHWHDAPESGMQLGHPDAAEAGLSRGLCGNASRGGSLTRSGLLRGLARTLNRGKAAGRGAADLHGFDDAMTGLTGLAAAAHGEDMC